MDCLLLGGSWLRKAAQMHRCSGNVLSGLNKLWEIIPSCEDVALHLTGAASSAARRVAHMRRRVMRWVRWRRRLRILLPLSQLVAVCLRLRQGLCAMIRWGASLNGLHLWKLFRRSAMAHSQDRGWSSAIISPMLEPSLSSSLSQRSWKEAGAVCHSHELGRVEG